MHVLVFDGVFLSFLSTWRVHDTFFILELLGEYERKTIGVILLLYIKSRFPFEQQNAGCIQEIQIPGKDYVYPKPFKNRIKHLLTCVVVIITVFIYF